MKRDWIAKREKDATRFFPALDISRLDQLINSTLFIHVSYGNDDDGWTAMVKAHQVDICKYTIEFIFRDPFVEITLDTAQSKLGGDFEDFESGYQFVITALTYNGERWAATTLENGAVGEISANLDVKIIHS